MGCSITRRTIPLGGTSRGARPSLPAPPPPTTGCTGRLHPNKMPRPLKVRLRARAFDPPPVRDSRPLFPCAGTSGALPLPRPRFGVACGANGVRSRAVFNRWPGVPPREERKRRLGLFVPRPRGPWPRGPALPLSAVRTGRWPRSLHSNGGFARGNGFRPACPPFLAERFTPLPCLLPLCCRSRMSRWTCPSRPTSFSTRTTTFRSSSWGPSHRSHPPMEEKCCGSTTAHRSRSRSEK